MNVELRAVRRAELEQVYDLLAIAFPEASREMFVAQTERDSTFRLRHGRVAVDHGGRIVGYVRVFARTMLVRGLPIAAGGIGSVATAPDARGDGIATALLEDAIEAMRRDAIAISFLFTGIPAFYGRLGYEIVRQPYFQATRSEIIAARTGSYYNAHLIDLSKDLPQLVAMHRQALAGATGAIARTKSRWLDARWWLNESGAHTVIASRDGARVAYLRSRCRGYGHEILEAECRPGHARAITELVEMAALRPCDCGDVFVALAPDAHPLSSALRLLPSTTETTDVRYPMMMRFIAEDALRTALPDADAVSIGARFPNAEMRFWNSDRI